MMCLGDAMVGKCNGRQLESFLEHGTSWNPESLQGIHVVTFAKDQRVFKAFQTKLFSKHGNLILGSTRHGKNGKLLALVCLASSDVNHVVVTRFSVKTMPTLSSSRISIVVVHHAP